MTKRFDLIDMQVDGPHAVNTLAATGVPGQDGRVDDVQGTAEAVEHGWYAVRSVFQYGNAAPHVYEERITIWRASSFDAAVVMAEAEAAEYTEGVDRVHLGFAQVHHLSAEPGHGAEIYSLMRDSNLPADAYLDRFFDTGDERQGILPG
ncbi:hypothetical protein GA0070606_5096 [Micromonospora citrea]|uniref:DUF4288 domain-containing protein n=1 Tax=Micromonospora citrea TaxID=47855 RepID=A0A1C6VT82_9ACTN|nr:hypothetical protein [Micromonospora citrea]SCL69485.1 hypothetical protein GA0070606_5096 [Micromonospora citrea]